MSNYTNKIVAVLYSLLWALEGCFDEFAFFFIVSKMEVILVPNKIRCQNEIQLAPCPGLKK